MRRFGNVPELEKKYVRRQGVYAILTRGDQILLTYQEEPDFEFQLPGGGDRSRRKLYSSSASGGFRRNRVANIKA